MQIHTREEYKDLMREKITGGWIKLHNDELHTFYSAPNIIRVIKSRIGWAGNVVVMGEVRNRYSILVGKPDGKLPVGS
jgi:hypothetical protein